MEFATTTVWQWAVTLSRLVLPGGVWSSAGLIPFGIQLGRDTQGQGTWGSQPEAALGKYPENHCITMKDSAGLKQQEQSHHHCSGCPWALAITACPVNKAKGGKKNVNAPIGEIEARTKPFKLLVILLQPFLASVVDVICLV